MPRVFGKHVKCIIFTPDHLMEIAGYTSMPNGSWIFPFRGRSRGYAKSNYRFHCYLITPDTLEIHTDLIKSKGGKEYHIASTYQMREEAKRLRALMRPAIEAQSKENKRVKRKIEYAVFEPGERSRIYAELADFNGKPIKKARKRGIMEVIHKIFSSN